MTGTLCSGLEDTGSYRPQVPCQVDLGRPCAACTQVEDLALEISSGRPYRKDISEQHCLIRTQINRSHSPTILQAPPEITSLIFRFCFPPTEVTHLSRTLLPATFQKSVAARLVLGAVCREWRSIAWSTPHLWTEIAVRLHSRLPWNANFIREWLNRSGALPLTVLVTGSDFDEADDYHRALNVASRASHFLPHAVAAMAANALNPFSDRWHVLEMRFVPGNFLSLLTGNSSSQSILKALSLRGGYGIAPDPSFMLENAVMTPARVILDQISFKGILVAWDRVTRIQIGGCFIAEYFQLLEQVPSLQDLTMDCLPKGRSDGNPMIYNDPITHRQLQHLHISEFDVGPLSIFLGAFVFPALVSLRIASRYEALPIASLTAFLQHSWCQLKTLDIHGTNFDDNGITSILESTPYLITFMLTPLPTSDYRPDELLRQLAQSDEPFLPQLRHLVYDATEQLQLIWSKTIFPWHLVPAASGPPSGPRNRHARPLRYLDIYTNSKGRSGQPLATVNIADFVDFRNNSPDRLASGINLRVRFMDSVTESIADVGQTQRATWIG